MREEVNVAITDRGREGKGGRKDAGGKKGEDWMEPERGKEGG